MTFDLQATDPQTKARAGLLQTGHGPIQTPIFMPVGTAGTVKAVHQRELTEDIQAQIILGNTYHLYLRPGLDVLENEKLNALSPAQQEVFNYLAASRKVVLTPHVAGWTHQSYVKINQVLVSKLQSVLFQNDALR